VTAPWAKRITGVFAAFRVNLTVTPAGMMMVVKLKIPLGERATVTVHGVGVHVGLKGPSAPVLPLLKVWAAAGEPNNATRAAPRSRLPSDSVRGFTMRFPPYSPISLQPGTRADWLIAER
jgi:hypothetical protein